MPTYQYACTACGHQLEAVQSFTDDPLTQCPECQGRLRKLFGSVGVVFKGPGFYRTDSRANGKVGANGKPNGKSDPSSAGEKSSPGEKPASSEKPSSGEKSSGKSGDKAPATNATGS